MLIPEGWRTRVLLMLLLAVGGSPSTVRAQTSTGSPTRDRVWLNGGLGIGRARGGLFGSATLATGLSLTYQPGLVLFSARVAGVWSLLQGDLLGDAAVLVGLGTRGRRSHVSITAGPAVTGGNVGIFGKDSTSFSSRLGAGFQVQLLGLPLEGIGLGLTGFANVNAHQSFGGVMLSLVFGQLR